MMGLFDGGEGDDCLKLAARRWRRRSMGRGSQKTSGAPQQSGRGIFAGAAVSSCSLSRKTWEL